MGHQKWSPLEAIWSPKLEAHNPCYFQDVLSEWSDNVIKHINICFYCMNMYMFYPQDIFHNNNIYIISLLQASKLHIQHSIQ